MGNNGCKKVKRKKKSICKSIKNLEDSYFMVLPKISDCEEELSKKDIGIGITGTLVEELKEFFGCE